MFYIVNYTWFYEKFTLDRANVKNDVSGKFLIIKEKEEKEVYLCDMAIVTKRNVDYYDDFTRLFLKDNVLLNKSPSYQDNFSIKITKDNEHSVFTQVTSDKSYYKLVVTQTKPYAKKILSQLFDLGVISKKSPYSQDIELAKKYLLSHNRSRYAFNKGVNFLFSKNKIDFINTTALDELSINLVYMDKKESLNLKFTHDIVGRMPINIFIGKNGAGKSYTIEQIIKCYLNERNQHLSDNINKIIMISNTVNDNYPSTSKSVRAHHNKNKDFTNDDYEYFSTLRGKKYSKGDGVETFDLSKLINEMIKREITKEMPFNALKILEDVIKDNIKCTISGIDSNCTSFKSLSELLSSAERHHGINDDQWLTTSHLSLVRDGRVIKLSSGQENFILIISCILTSIQNNSLVFIDELENFLHPNFISQAMKTLKQCLIETNSICVLATHSLHIAREIPRVGVTIFENNPAINEIILYNPDIESYSCNLQLMSNYIFNTKEESSIFDSTLRNVAKKYKNKKDLIDDLGETTSREIILSIADRINEN
ncbi:TPA: AAA family ATPase [Serratia fonticola]